MLGSDVKVPNVLMGRLEFGNVKQIAALKALEREIIEQEERTEKIENGQIKKYRVNISVTGDIEIEVWATSEQEARELDLIDNEISELEIKH